MIIKNIKKLGFPQGILREANPVKIGYNALDYVVDLFKRVLDYMHVAHIDPCCPNDIDKLPVNYNSTSDTLQYYDPEIEQYVDVVPGVVTPPPVVLPPATHEFSTIVDVIATGGIVYSNMRLLEAEDFGLVFVNNQPYSLNYNILFDPILGRVTFLDTTLSVGDIIIIQFNEKI